MVRPKVSALILSGLVASLCARPSWGQGLVVGETQEIQAKIALDTELKKYPQLQHFAEGIVPHRQPSLREADRSLAGVHPEPPKYGNYILETGDESAYI